ncbi:hypothetical protein [Sphingobium fontiphilum]|uniref:hypothetical protein n=1 Tax=Sphingobium fontiphilum TaxID=944425 RepID=UPI003CCE0216
MPAAASLAKWRSESGFDDGQRGLRAGIGAFAGAVFQAFGDDFVIDIDDAVLVELVYLRAYFGADAVAATCGLIDYNFQAFGHAFLLSGHQLHVEHLWFNMYKHITEFSDGEDHAAKSNFHAV